MLGTRVVKVEAGRAALRAFEAIRRPASADLRLVSGGRRASAKAASSLDKAVVEVTSAASSNFAKHSARLAAHLCVGASWVTLLAHKAVMRAKWRPIAAGERVFLRAARGAGGPSRTRSGVGRAYGGRSEGARGRLREGAFPWAATPGR